LLAVTCGAALTSWRARRRQSQPLSEGLAASLGGFILASFVVYLAMFLAAEVPILEFLSVLPLALPACVAAFVGAVLGGWRPRDDPSWRTYREQ
jgi:hypothetical protein